MERGDLRENDLSVRMERGVSRENDLSVRMEREGP
jgi:hypothetical protein